MTADYGSLLRSRRAILQISQRDLARHAGGKQPLIAAIEAGTRMPSADTRAALDRAVAIRPSTVLAARRDQVRKLFNQAGLPEPQVFGSVARGDDNVDSDINLLVEFTDFGADAAYTVSLGVNEFVADTPPGRVLRNNGRHILVQIATVVERLPESFKQTHSVVDWVSITRMRNLIAHHYDKADDRLVFTTLQRRIPEFLVNLGLDD